MDIHLNNNMIEDQKKEYMRKWREKNKDHLIAYRKKVYDTKENTEYCKKRRAKFPEYYTKYLKKYNSREDVIDKKREKNLKNKYNLTLKMYAEMLKKQNNKCEICKVDQKELTYKLHVDHDHVNGKIRGLLCPRCNVALGYFEKSDIKELEKYINKYRKDVN